MRHFCTLFNSVYQHHAQVLYESICANDSIENLQFYFFCFDQESLAFFGRLALKNVHLISLEELEAYSPELKNTKSDRSRAEYFFTATPVVCKYVFDNFSAVDEVVYLDADLCFFQSVEVLFREIGPASISIIPHRFNLLNYYKNIFGYFNVGWISFKRTTDGIACLTEWYQNTIDWCFDRLTWSRYADQKYLNRWSAKFPGVCVIKNIGANVAPWNVGNYKLHLYNGEVYVNDVPLIFYHFASLKLVDGSYYTTISSYLSYVKADVIDLVYRPYLSKLYSRGFVPKPSVRLNTGTFVTKIRKAIRHLLNDSVTAEDLQGN